MSGLDAGVAVFVGNGDGTFERKPDAVVPSPWNIVAADFDRDGTLDLVSADIVGTIYLLRGRGDGTFAGPVAKPIGFQIDAAAACDVDADGIPTCPGRSQSPSGARMGRSRPRPNTRRASASRIRP